jgi:hypothetical protein
LNALKTKEMSFEETFVSLRKQALVWALHCAIEMQEAVLEMESEKDKENQGVQNGREVLSTALKTATVVNVDAKAALLHSG